ASWTVARFWSNRTEKRDAVAAELFFAFSSTSAWSFCLRFTEPLLRANAALQFGRTMNWILVGATAAGLLFTWWARFHLGALWSDLVVMKAGHQVVDTGPYGLVRHPIYSGLIFGVVATALQKRTGVALLAVAVVTMALSAKARRGERFLRKELGE